MLIQALLALQFVRGLEPDYGGIARAAMDRDTIAQQQPEGAGICGWVGVTVSPMTAAFAESLGMVQPYGAIFDAPEPGSPAAAEHIEQGDVITTINGIPLAKSGDFAATIAMTAPGTLVYFDTWRNGEAIQRKLVVGAVRCRTNG